jgi:spoIIIJ-associated protein
MPIVDHAAAAQKIAAFLKTLTTTGGLRLKYRITAGAGAHDPDGLEAREIYVEMAGPDAVLLTQRERRRQPNAFVARPGPTISTP